MASFRWGKFSGRSRGAGHGLKGRKCEKIDNKDAMKCKESVCTWKRGFWRGRCMKIPTANASINSTVLSSRRGRSDPTSDQQSFHEAELHNRVDTVGTYQQSFHEAELLNRVDMIGTCKGMIHEQGKEKQDNKMRNCDCEWHETCVDDVNQSVQSSVCSKDGAGCTESMGDSKVSSQESGCMAHAWQDALSGERGADVYDNTEHEDSRKAFVHKAGKEAPLLGVNSEGKFEAHVDCDAGTRKTDEISMHNRAVRLVMVPHDFVCEMSNKLMEDPVVIASGRTFERAYIQAWLDEGNTHCPLTHKHLSHFELIPNYTLKTLISSWLATTFPDLGLEASQSTFVSCMSSFTSCPSSTHGSHQEFVSCSTFSISKLLDDSELPSFASSSSSSLPKLLMDTERDSISLSSVSACSSSTPKHLRVGLAQDLSSASQSPRSSLCWEQELHSSQENLISECKKSDQFRRGEYYLELPKRSQESSVHSMVIEFMSLLKRPSEYTMSRIDSLVCDLHSNHIDIQRSAAAELRLLAKHEDSNRILIANAGAVKPLIDLLQSVDESVQLEATTTLLNLSLNHTLKEYIVKEGASEALVGALRNGLTVVVKENAAVALAYLAVCEANRGKIGSAGAVMPLVNLLKSGSFRGKKDAAAALYRLSSMDENKRRMVSAGVLRVLVGFMANGGDKEGMVDKAMAILRNLVSIEEGRVAFVEEGGIMSLLQVIGVGSQRSRGLAVSILFQLCIHSSKHRSLVLQKEPLPMLMSISNTENSRLKSQVAEMIEVLLVDA